MNDESTYKHKKYWCAEVESYLSQKAVLAFSLNQPLDFHPTSNISTVLNWCNSFQHVPNFKAHYLWNNTKKTKKKTDTQISLLGWIWKLTDLCKNSKMLTIPDVLLIDTELLINNSLPLSDLNTGGSSERIEEHEL